MIREIKCLNCKHKADANEGKHICDGKPSDVCHCGCLRLKYHKAGKEAAELLEKAYPELARGR